MTIEEKKEAEGKTEAAGDTETRNKPETPLAVKQANEAREKLELENTRLEKNIQELKELTARNILGGGTDATRPEALKEETPAEYAKRIMSGKV